MTQAYSDPERESDPYALPNIEVFQMLACEFSYADPDSWMAERAKESSPKELAGWYYWYCFPGCLPDSDPVGPFETEQAALDDAQSNEES